MSSVSSMSSDINSTDPDAAAILAATPAPQDAGVEHESKHVRLLVDSNGRVQFLLVVNDNEDYFVADAFHLGGETVETVTTALTEPHACWMWQGALGADAYAHFHIKWDSCSNWGMGRTVTGLSGDRSMHTCSRQDWVHHLALMEHVYTLAMNHIPEPEACKNDDWFRENRQPLMSQWGQTLTLSEDRIAFPQQPTV